MRLVVISHKECWRSVDSLSGFATIGGFPFQMQAISELFDETMLLVPVRNSPLPAGTRPLTGYNLRVHPLREPAGTGLLRKVALLAWLPRHLPCIWRAVKDADAVHTPVPGDIGTLGLLVALAQHKPLFVRHCGIWGKPVTLSDRFLLWLLERIAGGRNVVMATGGAALSPSRNPHIQWIFSTTLSRQELASIPVAQPWQRGEPFRLVSVGRLSPDKNTAAVVNSLPRIRETYPDVRLSIVGDGEILTDLQRLAGDLGVMKRVTFHGNVSHSQVLHILSQSHLFVFPTLREGFPKSVLEAMACGLPIIATPVSVIPHLVGEQSGILLKEPDAGAVVDAVLSLISNPQRLASMGANARRVAMGYSLEAWRDTIGERLSASWGPLHQIQPGHVHSTVTQSSGVG